MLIHEFNPLHISWVLWCQNVQQLRRQAEEWAKRKAFINRRRVASLLDGAYEIELANEDPENSFVLQTLREWIECVHAELTASTTNRGCAAANAYGLIGKKSPEPALQGLEQLLVLPQSQDMDDIRALFAAGVSTYVSLIWSGHLRSVLAHLGADAKRYAHDWSPPKSVELRQRYRRERQIRLHAIFEAFFLIAAAASHEIQPQASQFYLQPLSEEIHVPDQYGRDILLTTVLVHDANREHILMLFCSAIVAINSKPAFDQLHQWAKGIMALQQTQEDVAKQLYTAFIQFLVELGKMIDTWCRELVEQGYRQLAASDVYRHKLEQWSKERSLKERSINMLAQEALSKLQDEKVS